MNHNCSVIQRMMTRLDLRLRPQSGTLARELEQKKPPLQLDPRKSLKINSRFGGTPRNPRTPRNPDGRWAGCSAGGGLGDSGLLLIENLFDYEFPLLRKRQVCLDGKRFSVG